jgi:Ala-tRNA(Pro) deacylase
MGASAISHADPSLLEWLGSHDVEYEVHEHAPAYTARGVAKAEGVDPHTFAKVVAVRTKDGRSAFLVIETTDQLDLRKAARTLGADEVRLLSEGELATLAPTIEVGAVPAIGALYGVPMVADYAVRDDRDISFNAGSHSCSVRVERVGWERASGVVYADLAADRDDRPAWALS